MKLNDGTDNLRLKIWFEKYENVRTGKTIAVIWDGNIRYVGLSSCHERDQFCKKIGKIIAINRAKHIRDIALDLKRPRSDIGYNKLVNIGITDVEIKDKYLEEYKNGYYFNIDTPKLEILQSLPEWLYLDISEPQHNIEVTDETR